MQSFLRKIYLFSFLDIFLLIFPVFTLMFQNQGLSTFQISVLILIWSSVTLTLEVPTGVLADKYSRRNLLILGKILQTVGFIFWLIGGSFFNFAIGFIMWGLKNVLTSGTFEALVYDELKSIEREQDYEKVNGKIQALDTLSIAVASLLGGIIAQYFGFTITMVATVTVSLLTVFVLFSIKPAKAYESTGEVKYWLFLKEALRQLKTHPVLLQLVTVLCLVTATYYAVDEFWALIYKDFGLAVFLIGGIYAVNNLMTSLAGWTSHWFSSLKTIYLKQGLMILIGFNLILIGLLHSLMSVFFALLAAYAVGIIKVKLETQLQHAITSNQRATVTSMKSLLFELIYMVFIFLFGSFANRFGISTILYIAGGVIILTGLFSFTRPKINKICIKS